MFKLKTTNQEICIPVSKIVSIRNEKIDRIRPAEDDAG